MCDETCVAAVAVPSENNCLPPLVAAYTSHLFSASFLYFGVRHPTYHAGIPILCVLVPDEIS